LNDRLAAIAVLQDFHEGWEQWTGYLHSWSPAYGAFSLKAHVAPLNYTGPFYREMRYSVLVVRTCSSYL
jgi:hypothetical protein